MLSLLFMKSDYCEDNDSKMNREKRRGPSLRIKLVEVTVGADRERRTSSSNDMIRGKDFAARNEWFGLLNYCDH
jgi:hypothetical protein